MICLYAKIIRLLAALAVMATFGMASVGSASAANNDAGSTYEVDGRIRAI